MKYSTLAGLLWNLEVAARTKAASPHSSIMHLVRNVDFLYHALDYSQVMQSGAFSDLDLPVVVAVGANYADNGTALPTASLTGCVPRSPFLEAALVSWRNNLKRFWSPPLPQARRSSWKGKMTAPLLGVDWATPPVEFHLVMMNLVPWITVDSWSKIRNSNFSDALRLLAYPPHGVCDFNEFLAINREFDELREPPIWVGHGNSEIYELFLHLTDAVLAASAPIVWFTSNLGYLPDKKTVAVLPGFPRRRFEAD